MRILSKYKDYYDYLTVKYGIDPLLILDRRDYNEMPKLYSQPCKLQFYICGLLVEGYYDGKEFYYGEKLKKIGNFPKRYSWQKPIDDQIIIKESNRDVYVNINVKHSKENYNKLYNCPILMKGCLNEKLKYPQLSKYNLQQILPAEIIYQLLVKYLSDINSEKENKSDNRTNNEKILTNGFDLKSSFRHSIK